MNQRTRFALAVIGAIAASFGPFAHAQLVTVSPLTGITLPSIPTGMTATVIPPAQVSISWTAATESSGTIEGYYVYRNGGQIATTAGTTFVDSGLTSGLYYYTVAAYDANGAVSAQSPSASVTVVQDTIPPSTPTNVTVTGTMSSNSFYGHVVLAISWTASTDNVGVAGYEVYRNGAQITQSTSSPVTGTSVTDTVAPGTYTYTVAAYDAAQNFSNRSASVTATVVVDAIPPTTPTNVSAEQISGSSVNLTWASSTDNVGVAGYQIYRNGSLLTTTPGSPYADNGLASGSNVSYVYRVAAYDAAGNVSPQSVPVSVAFPTANGPGAPYGLSAIVTGTSTVDVSWAPSIDVLQITAYTVYRDGTQIASVTSTNYTDTGLATGTYMYGVSATDISGAVSPVSSSTTAIVRTVVATPPPAFPFPPGGTSAATSVNVIPGTVPSSVAAGSPAFTQFLYFGLRSSQVEALQSLLAGNGYLAPTAATGFFGNLTLAALQKFQCDQGIVCTGGAGWGMVGPKTRTALNALEAVPASSSASSASALNAEIAALEAELANLEKRLSP